MLKIRLQFNAGLSYKTRVAISTVLNLQMNCHKIVLCMLFCDDHLFFVDTYNNPYQGTLHKCGSMFFFNLFVIFLASSEKTCTICFVVVWNYIIYKILFHYLFNDYKEGKASQHNVTLTCIVRPTTWDSWSFNFVLPFLSVLPQRTFSSIAVFKFN